MRVCVFVCSFYKQSEDMCGWGPFWLVPATSLTYLRVKKCFKDEVRVIVWGVSWDGCG